jgi:hypothetical protein
VLLRRITQLLHHSRKVPQTTPTDGGHRSRAATKASLFTREYQWKYPLLR